MTRHVRRRSLSKQSMMVAVMVSGAMALTLSSCADDGTTVVVRSSPTLRTAPGPVTTKTASTPSAVAPLTNLPAKVNVSGPAVAVVIDGTSATGLSGLDGADLVYSEFVEEGRQRLLAVFHSDLAGTAGPVAQTRIGDRELLRVLGPMVVFRGGSARSVFQMQRSELTSVNGLSKTGPFQGRGDGRTDVRLAAVVDDYGSAVSAPTSILTFADGSKDSFASQGLKKASTLSVAVSGHSTEQWRYAAATGSWTRSGSSLPVANLIVQQVTMSSTTLARGLLVPVPSLVGRGKAVAVSGPQSVVGEWSRAKMSTNTNYADSDNVPLRLRPGRTWIMLVPSAAQIAVR